MPAGAYRRRPLSVAKRKATVGSPDILSLLHLSLLCYTASREPRSTYHQFRNENLLFGRLCAAASRSGAGARDCFGAVEGWKSAYQNEAGRHGRAARRRCAESAASPLLVFCEAALGMCFWRSLCQQFQSWVGNFDVGFFKALFDCNVKLVTDNE